MSKRKNNNRGKTGGANINPQGYTEDKADQQPKTELQQRAKTKNTKI
ncbi:small, acid-soluble spore protein L [Pontibacillus sp. ALD_SL1]|nr:small, acid-soluble spore protein L [Pontibacillus sp. ALD_SL1]QST00788.1 small, acid-soluble spore protein L [Pontibacillus sp. ALD_SL1]